MTVWCMRTRRLTALVAWKFWPGLRNLPAEPAHEHSAQEHVDRRCCNRNLSGADRGACGFIRGNENRYTLEAAVYLLHRFQRIQRDLPCSSARHAFRRTVAPSLDRA